MDYIKLRIFTIVLFLIFFIFLFPIIINNNYVQATEAEVSIEGEPTYRLIRNILKNNEIVGKIYEINITLINSGATNSDEIIVNLTDEELFTLSKKIILAPGETEVISFTWSTLLIKNQQMIINFYPSNPDIDWNKNNSGSKVFTLYITDGNDIKATSTPGFEIVFLITSMLIFTLYLKKKK